MATEVSVLRWCDIHLQEKDEKVPAAEWTVTVANGVKGQPMVLDLCADCAAPLQGVRELLAAYGRKPDKAGPVSKRGGQSGNLGGAANKAQDKEAQQAAAQPGGLVCMACGFKAGSRKSLAGHARNIHQVPLAEVEGQLQGLTCLVCDPPQTFKSVRAATIHVGQSHPVG